MPAATAIALLIPATATGAPVCAVVPLPTCPNSLYPQHRNVALAKTAHVWPTPASIAADCPAADARYGTGCFFDPAYRPAPYSAKVRPRPGGTRWPAMTARQEWLWGRLGQVGIAP